MTELGIERPIVGPVVSIYSSAAPAVSHSECTTGRASPSYNASYCNLFKWSDRYVIRAAGSVDCVFFPPDFYDEIALRFSGKAQNSKVYSVFILG